MKDMVTEAETSCPFAFNFDPATFKVGDIVSYQVPEAFGEMPFVGELVEVADDHVILRHYGMPGGDAKCMRCTRESRPVVSKSEALE